MKGEKKKFKKMEQAADRSHDNQGELRPLPGGFKLLSGTNTLASARARVCMYACAPCVWMGACGCGQNWSDNESSVGAPEIPPTANCITVSAGAHAQLDGGTGKPTLQDDTENLGSIIGSAHGNHRWMVVWTAELMLKNKQTRNRSLKMWGRASTEKDALCPQRGGE